MEYKTGKIVEEAIRAMGVVDVEQFIISEAEKAQGPSPSQEMSMMEATRGANVVPQEELMRQAEAGNVVPMERQAPEMGG